TVDPTTQGHLLSDVGLTQLPAIFCTHEISLNLAAGYKVAAFCMSNWMKKGGYYTGNSARR
ncbi:MAG TPA: hypothetical protein DEG10_05730, partial [Leclercia adecarboxylata]|nr:hypothetical protein [Leclercia adecarboxylata]